MKFFVVVVVKIFFKYTGGNISKMITGRWGNLFYKFQMLFDDILMFLVIDATDLLIHS